MAKMKVKELPKEEQEKILAQMKDLQIRGIYTEMSVETANKKIEEALKAKKDGESQDSEGIKGNAAQNDAQDEKTGSDDTQGGDDKKEGENSVLNAGENESTEQTPAPASENSENQENSGENPPENDEDKDKEIIVAGDGGVHVVPAENEQTDGDNSEDESKEDSTEEQADEPATEEIPASQTDEPGPKFSLDSTKEQSVKPVEKTICHICRSAVINGKCTGCGFTTNNGG